MCDYVVKDIEGWTNVINEGIKHCVYTSDLNILLKRTYDFMITGVNHVLVKMKNVGNKVNIVLVLNISSKSGYTRNIFIDMCKNMLYVNEKYVYGSYIDDIMYVNGRCLLGKYNMGGISKVYTTGKYHTISLEESDMKVKNVFSKYTILNIYRKICESLLFNNMDKYSAKELRKNVKILKRYSFEKLYITVCNGYPLNRVRESYIYVFRKLYGMVNGKGDIKYDNTKYNNRLVIIMKVLPWDIINVIIKYIYKNQYFIPVFANAFSEKA